MNKYIVRVYGMVEITMQAESLEQAMAQCDLNTLDLNKLPHQITEIDDVVEVEEV
ncbi:hypothetical protein ACLS0F_06760 [Avibacterium endocarditidis]|uniref:hypothetical protein n=1 Tax=Avibacterium endocarditidis TaxID=380674 RepID=UPI003BF901E9